MTQLLRQTWIETKLFVRGMDNLFWTLAFPVFFVVLYGLIYGEMVWDEYGMRAFEYTLPGIVVMALMVTGIMHTAIGFAEDREKGVFRRLSLTPLRPAALLGGQLLHRYGLVLVQATLILALGSLAFGARSVGRWIDLWIAITGGALCFLSLGFLLAGLVRSAKAANGIAMVVFFLFLFLGDIFFPADVLPDSLAFVSRGLPSSLVNASLRGVMIGGERIGAMWRELLGIGAWFLVSFVLAVRLFRWE